MIAARSRGGVLWSEVSRHETRFPTPAGLTMQFTNNESLVRFAKNYQRELWRLVKNKAPRSSFHSHATPRDHHRGRRPHPPPGMIARYRIPGLLPGGGGGEPGRDR